MIQAIPKPIEDAASGGNDPKPFHPFCKECGWRKGGVDSWNGSACKCGHSEPSIKPLEIELRRLEKPIED